MPLRPTRDAALEVIATYERVIEASIERVWENVLDWEHLPWVHANSFAAIEIVEAGDWGWKARVGFPGTDSRVTIELRVDRAGARYVTRNLEPSGGVQEIWTDLDPVATRRTGIRVEFCAEPTKSGDSDAIGKIYVDLYRELWDQDESMMRARQQELDRIGAASEVEASRCLGPLLELESRLPCRVEFGSGTYTIGMREGAPFIHSARCPHQLGPLAPSTDDPGELVCPWHGYRFDAGSGRSCDGRGLRLTQPPRLEVDLESGQVWLHPAGTASGAAGRP